MSASHYITKKGEEAALDNQDRGGLVSLQARQLAKAFLTSVLPLCWQKMYGDRQTIFFLQSRVSTSVFARVVIISVCHLLQKHNHFSSQENQQQQH